MDLKNMMADVKNKMDSFKDDLAHIRVTGQSGAGMVKATITGDHYLESLEIDDSVLKNDKAVVIELIKAAINGAVSDVEAETKQKMMTMSKGIELPEWLKNAAGDNGDKSE